MFTDLILVFEVMFFWCENMIFDWGIRVFISRVGIDF